MNAASIAAEPSSVAERLLSSFPSGSYCLPALLQLAEVVETTSVPTAAVECRMHPRLLINPEWVARHAGTPEKLVMLVMHELHHVILGHTRLFPRATPLDNLVFDAVINSMLSHLFPGRIYRALFHDIYDDAAFPECFLRPPVRWSPGVQVDIPRALSAPGRAHLAALYERLYSPTGASYEELRDALRGSVDGDAIDPGRLLGDHREEQEDASSAGGLETRSPALLAEIRRIVERWPRPRNPIAGRTVHAELERARLTLPPASPRDQLVGLLRQVAHRRTPGAWRKRREHRSEGEGPLLRPDRRTAVMRSLGMRPLLQRQDLSDSRIEHRGERVHVYLDVSGSVTPVLPDLVRAVLDCRSFVHPTVHLFSTLVVDAGIDELRNGDIRTTFGTSIGCVAAHLDAHRIRRAVLVTDGFVGTPGVRARAMLANRTLGVALTPGSSTRTDLDGLVSHWTQLCHPTS